MTAKEVTDSIGYCGLVCALCHGAENCSGCKSKENSCGRYLSAEGCYQYKCCVDKGINGCWECKDSPCTEDMFSEHHDIRNRVFVKVARAEGIEKLGDYVWNNQQRGILYGWNKDYDGLGSEEAGLQLLHSGTSNENIK